MINCIIIDDEENARVNLSSMLQTYHPDLNILAQADGVKSAVELIQQHKPQLLFLDIEMNDGNGFQVLEQCKDLSFEVIFVTAYEQYSLKAIKFTAIDYVLKPINKEHLKLAVQKAMHQIGLKQENERLRNLIRNTRLSNPNKRIALPFVDSIEFVEVKNIIRLEADGSYTKIYTNEPNELMVSGNLKEFAEMLESHDFIRTHQAHLVNPEYIRTIVKSDGGYLLLKNGDSVPVSRLRKAEVIDVLKRG